MQFRLLNIGARWTAFFLLASTAVFSGGANADDVHEHFDVAISAAPTHNMVLQNGAYVPTGAHAVLNVSDLMKALAAGNIEVSTRNGAGGSALGNLDVDAAMFWVSPHSLVLHAYRSVRVRQPVTDAGTGALTIMSHEAKRNGRLEFYDAGRIVFWGLGNALSIDGKSYVLVNSVASLATAIASAPDGNYALARSYDASVDKTYRNTPVATVFEGNFDGLGNTISNLSTHGVGFFYLIDIGASVSNFRLLNVNIEVARRNSEFSVGGLAGASGGTLYDDEVSGTVSNSWGSLEEGGLIGGGSGSIVHCSSTAALKPHKSAAQSVGGLAGEFSGWIDDSSSTADITAVFVTSAAGGLVGEFSGYLRHSHASGNVRVPAEVNFSGVLGGLAGVAFGKIADSYATGNIKIESGNTFESAVGGLAGYANGTIKGSFATGRVETGYNADTVGGGLVGESTASITNSYATGAILESGYNQTDGGLIGQTDTETGLITASYSTGKMTGSGIGGFAGYDCGCFSNDYWDISTSGTTDGIGTANGSGVTGYTTHKLRSGLPPGFDPAVWAENPNINRGLPYLIANPPPQ